MKFLMMVCLVVGSFGAFAQPGGNDWEIKCFEKDGHDLELAYKIKVGNNNPTLANWRLQLEDCTQNGAPDMMTPYCRDRGWLKKEERQDEVCLELKHGGGYPGGSTEALGDSWSLCYQEQETFNPRKLVPVSVYDDNQESRIYCEREILHILR